MGSRQLGHVTPRVAYGYGASWAIITLGKLNKDRGNGTLEQLPRICRPVGSGDGSEKDQVAIPAFSCLLFAPAPGTPS